MPRIAFFAFVFLLPPIWWPPARSRIALLLYAAFALPIIPIVYLLVTNERREGAYYTKMTAVIVSIFCAFVFYVWIYRKVCL